MILGSLNWMSPLDRVSPRIRLPPFWRLHSWRVCVDDAQMTSVPTTKDLASVARAGRFSQARARDLQERFVRRNWPLLLLLASVILVPSAIAAAFASGVLRGVLIGASLATTAGVLIHFTVLLSGSGPAKMGTLAEQWTVQELKVVQGHGYFLINGAFLRGGDLDHVLIGPGGVFLLRDEVECPGVALEPWRSLAPQRGRPGHGSGSSPESVARRARPM